MNEGEITSNQGPVYYLKAIDRPAPDREGKISYNIVRSATSWKEEGYQPGRHSAFFLVNAVLKWHLNE